MTLTTLRTLGPALTKTWLADGTISTYDSAKRYTVRRRDIHTITDLFELLRRIEGDARTCIIRGAPGASALPGHPDDQPPIVERNLDTFHDAPSNLFMVDVDKWPGTVDGFIATLPSCFHDVSYVLQYSASHGHPSKPGLRAHLWFWLDEPMSCGHAESWAQAWAPMTDHTVHRTVQPNYTAAPRFAPGLADPMTERITFVQGLLGDTLIIPVDMPVPANAPAPTTSGRSGRALHVDPRGKPGVIGAVCRAYTPADIVDLFPETFAQGSKANRITWLAGGGTPEGIGVTTDGHGLFNTHATSPTGAGSANLFDFIRLHVWGHLDGDAEYDLLPSAAPSYVAMEAWARDQGEVDDELNPTTPAQAEKVTLAIEDSKDQAAEIALDKEVDLEQRLTNIAALIDRCETLTKLEHFVGRQVARAKLGDAEREVIAGKVAARSKQLNHGRALPMAMIRKWLKPVTVETRTSFPDLGPDGEVLGTIGNLEVLCGRNEITVRYDVIRKRQEILGSSMSYSPDNYENASFSALISMASAERMPHNAGQMKGYICEIASRNMFNPVLEWLESKPWDGRQRSEEVFKTIKLRPDFDADLARMMLRKWMIQAVAAAASPEALQTRGVLVLQGDQYMGKSRWVESLVPGHKDLVVLGRDIKPHDKDSVKIAVSHWIAELGEIDATFKKSDIASLKAFISNPSDSFRLPYAAAESKFQRRTVFMASVNPDTFLSDDTGNTRFWVIPILSVDHVHTVDMQQVWAEMLHCWRGGEQHWFEHSEMQRVNASSEMFRQQSPTELRVLERFAWELGRSGDTSVVWVERTGLQVAGLCGISTPTMGDLGQIGRVVKRLSGHGSRRTGAGVLMRVPLPRGEVDTDGLAI